MSFCLGTHDLRRGGVVAPPCDVDVAVDVPAGNVSGDDGLEFDVAVAGRREENDVKLSEDFEARALDAKLIEGTAGMSLSSGSCVRSAVLLLRECLNFLKSAIG